MKQQDDQQRTKGIYSSAVAVIVRLRARIPHPSMDKATQAAKALLLTL